MQDDCIFCKIANGVIPAATIYEDSDFRAILDLGPASRGHALLLPKEHAEDLFALPEETAAKALVVAKKIGAKMRKNLKCDGFNLLQNNGEVAGQSVFHFHLHMIPRYKGDGVNLPAWTPGTLTKEESEQIVQQIKNGEQ